MSTHEFLPTLDRITDEPPDKGAITVARLVMALVAILILWSLLGRLDIVVVADGKLVPETHVKIVQPAEAGVLRDILVREGDAVTQGQVLARLDDTLLSAEATAVSGNLGLKQLELRRVQAELEGRPLRRHADDDALLFAQVHQHHLASLRQFEESQTQAREEARRADAELAAARQQLARLEQLLPVFTREMAAYDGLRDKGYVSELDYNAKHRELIDARQGLAAQQETVTALVARQRQATHSAAQLQAQYRAGLAQQRAALTAEVQQLTQADKQHGHRRRQFELRAPQAGVVKDLATHTPGSVVQPGAVLMTLVPIHETLVAEVFVRNEDVGRLRPGLPVQVKVHAWRFQRYGMLGGEILTLAPDSAAPSSSDDTRPAGAFYKARVAIRPAGDGLIDQQPLAAGMTVTVEVDVGTRTPFEYLIDPVRGTVQRAGRE